MKKNAEVFDVHYNELSGLGDVLGEEVSPLELPLVQILPQVPSFAPGEDNVVVSAGESIVLGPGSYGLLEADEGAAITFIGGEYDFAEWNVGLSVDLDFDAPSEVRIQGKLSVDQGSTLGPSAGSVLDARDIVIFVTGINGSAGELFETPRAAKFGIGTTIDANVYVPNGTLWLRQNGQFTGGFLAKWVILGIGTTAEHQSSWE